MKVARTLEEPAERDNHVMFSHPRTWLRDLDPFARSKYPLTPAERARDRHLWGEHLSCSMPPEHVGIEIHVHELGYDLGRALYTTGDDGAPVQLAGLASWLPNIVTDPNCPPNRLYAVQGLVEQHLAGLVKNITSNIGTTPTHAYMNPATYAKLCKQLAPPKKPRPSMWASLYKALGFHDPEITARYAMPLIPPSFGAFFTEAV